MPRSGSPRSQPTACSRRGRAPLPKCPDTLPPLRPALLATLIHCVFFWTIICRISVRGMNSALQKYYSINKYSPTALPFILSNSGSTPFTMDYIYQFAQTFPLALRKGWLVPKIISGIAVTAASLLWCFQDYQAYLNLGPGGPPYNWKGWAWITFGIRPFALRANETLLVADYPPEGCHSDMKKLPCRSGPRAQLGGIAPHRQLSQFAPEAMRNVLSCTPSAREM